MEERADELIKEINDRLIRIEKTLDNNLKKRRNGRDYSVR